MLISFQIPTEDPLLTDDDREEGEDINTDNAEKEGKEPLGPPVDESKDKKKKKSCAVM